MADVSDGWPSKRRVSPGDLAEAKVRGERWTMLTSYDALTSPIFESAGARALLVGDSAAMVVLGHDSTLPVSLDVLVTLAGAVVRSTSTVMVVGDLPFGSYAESPEQAVRSAVRFFKEAGVQAVKLEGGAAVAPQIRAITEMGMPAFAHLGMTPQHVHAIGGMQRIVGRGESGDEVLADAKAVEAAGACAVVLEAVPRGLATRITESLTIPTIGIGAGSNCDAQVMVWQDMAGLTTGRTPRFVKRYADLHQALHDAASAFVGDVASRTYPDDEHSYE